MARSFLQLRAFVLLACTLSAYLEAQQRGTPKAPGNANAQEGQRVFATRCATCHGLDGGGGERGPDIANRREIQRLSDDALSHIVQAGVPGTGMPSFRALGIPRINAVVQHLRRLQGQNIGVALPGDAKRGKALFFGTPGCSQCHMVNGEGGFIASDLSNYANNRSAEEIRTAITDPNKDLNPRNRTVAVTTADGTTTTGIARNEDNFSLQLQTMDGAFHLFEKSELRGIEYQQRSLMPDDYGSKLARQDLDDLIVYLVKVGRTQETRKPEKKKDE